MTGHAVPGKVPARRAAVVSASIGAGHDGAAAQLTRELVDAGFAVDRHDFLDLLPGRFGHALCRAYAMELRHVPDSWPWLMRTVERHPRLGAWIGDLLGRAARRRTLAAL
ncbi:MAG TPA: hypothetical protein VJT31_20080, partial [Rugosimonospora sp.]|nr:hypothetical protein [Rugosimonospora sp.]